MKTTFLVAVAALVLAVPALARGNVEAGKAKSTTCAACHGADGVSAVATFPKLAGQNPDYLVHSLQAYRSGKRKNPIMSEMAKNLSDADIEDLAAYFAAQNGLTVKY